MISPVQITKKYYVKLPSECLYRVCEANRDFNSKPKLSLWLHKHSKICRIINLKHFWPCPSLTRDTQHVHRSAQLLVVTWMNRPRDKYHKDKQAFPEGTHSHAVRRPEIDEENWVFQASPHWDRKNQGGLCCHVLKGAAWVTSLPTQTRGFSSADWRRSLP